MFTSGSDTSPSTDYEEKPRRRKASKRSSGYFDESGFSTEPTPSMDSRLDELEEVLDDERPSPNWHAGADFGLLVLRLVVGALFIAHGLQKLFGWLQGDGITGTAELLTDFGYSKATALAWLTGLSELAGGTLLVLGLFTPVGAAAILGVMINVIAVKFDRAVFAGGIELEAVYAAAALALLFAGPGRVSLDRPTPWYRHAGAFGVVFLLVAVGVAASVLVVLR